MHKHSFNIRSGGWAGYKHGIASNLKSGITICLMEVAYDLLRIEQNNKMLGEIGQGISCQFLLAEPHRPRLGDTERCPDDTTSTLASAPGSVLLSITRVPRISGVAEQTTSASGKSDFTNASRGFPSRTGTNFPPILTSASPKSSIKDRDGARSNMGIVGIAGAVFG